MCVSDWTYNGHVIGTLTHNLKQPAQETNLLATVTSPESQPAICKSTLFVVIELLSRVWLFCHSMHSNPPDSSVHGISQVRILECVAMPFSREVRLVGTSNQLSQGVKKQSLKQPQMARTWFITDSFPIIPVSNLGPTRESKQAPLNNHMGFPGSSEGKESTCNAGDPSWIPGSASFPEEGIGYPLQYSWASLGT